MHSSSHLHSVVSILQKWCLPFSPPHQKDMSQFLLNLPLNGRLLHYFITKSYQLFHKQIPGQLPLVSGTFCFLACILIGLCQGYPPRNVDEIFAFTSLYMLLDHYIDDELMNILQRHQIIDDLSTYIKQYNLSSLPPSSTLSSTSFKIQTSLIQQFYKIITRVPHSWSYLKNCFEAEIMTMKLQTLDSFDRKFYLQLTRWKGGTTVEAIQSVLELPITSDEYELGASIQCIDDIADVWEDIEAGIHTVATYDLEIDGHLDHFFEETVHSIDRLSNKYTLFKPILLGYLLHVVSRNNTLSPPLKTLISLYIPTQSHESYAISLYHRLYSLLPH